jgi:hypothetical protein
MQTTLRSLLSVAVVTAAAALASYPAMAADATVNVPFRFTASGRQCPAGLYNIQLDKMNQAVRLTDAHGQVNMVWLAGPGNPGPSDKRVVLRFDRAGASYALRSVQDGPMVTERLDKKVPSEQLTEILGQ